MARRLVTPVRARHDRDLPCGFCQPVARWQCIRLLGIAAELLRDRSAQSRNFLTKQRDRIARCLDTLEKEFGTLGDDLALAQIPIWISTTTISGVLDGRP
ncbi:MAG TPA: hypothetical protein VFA65_16365 [Bryobacteraceae bacterium]|nr:hypothetical protein [Bryobacteraceae bacterium]